MKSININQNQFSDLLNIYYGVFRPIKKIPSELEVYEIFVKEKDKNSYFPFPIFFGISLYKYLKIKNLRKLNLNYKNKKIMTINNLKFFKLNKEFFGKKLFGKNFNKHPFYLKFKKNFIFLDFKINKIYKKFSEQIFYLTF